MLLNSRSARWDQRGTVDGRRLPSRGFAGQHPGLSVGALELRATGTALGGPSVRRRDLGLADGTLLAGHRTEAIGGHSRAWWLPSYRSCHLIEVGVKQLKNDLSAYLRRVASGEQVRVTMRGRPVADLVPAGRSRPMNIGFA